MADFTESLRNGVRIQKATLETKNTEGEGVRKKSEKFLISFKPEDFILIERCLDKAGENRMRINKSQVIRAALNLLASRDKKEFLEAINKIRKV